MRKYLLIGFLFLVGCAKSTNDSVATYIQLGDSYKVTLTGERVNMSHDIFSVRSTSPTSEVFLLPRISGEVEGHEIPVKKGYYAYVGKVTFSDNSMVVELYSEDTDSKSKRAISWNGTYQLRKSS